MCSIDLEPDMDLEPEECYMCPNPADMEWYYAKLPEWDKYKPLRLCSDCHQAFEREGLLKPKETQI